MKLRFQSILFPSLAAGFSITGVHAIQLLFGDEIGILFGTSTP